MSIDRRAVVAAAALAAMPARAQGARPERQVLAFYYGWYANPTVSDDWLHWQGPTEQGRRQSPTVNTPTLGLYDSHDPAVLRQHAIWGKAAGLTGFVSSWWGPGSFEDRSLELMLDPMHRQGLSVCAYIESQKKGAAGAEADLRHLVEHYADHPAWLKVGGRPVIFLYLQALRDFPAAGWRAAARRLAARGLPEPLLVGDVSPREAAEFIARAPHMDTTHVYVLAPYVKGMEPAEMRSWTGRTYPIWRTLYGDRIACATVIPGFDDTLVVGRPLPRPTVERHGGATFATLWQAAIDMPADWVLITSWNEWHEGSEIEPSRQHGSRYLAANATYARRFLAARP